LIGDSRDDILGLKAIKQPQRLKLDLKTESMPAPGDQTWMARFYLLGPFRLDAEAEVLYRGKDALALGQRAVALLRVLVERPNELITKDALMEAAWHGLAVEEGNLAVQIGALRRLLSNEPGGEGWIETMPRRGYRYVGPLAIEGKREAAPSFRDQRNEPYPGKILTIDDHALIREALRGVLNELAAAATILEASDGATAMQLIEQHHDISLVLLDLNLPDRDGFAVLSELRERHPAISIVVLSASQDRSTVTKALRKGAQGFIPKSATRDVMVQALRLVFAGGVYIPPQILEGDQSTKSSA
jgi:DNA-binding response OmpR family regulator